MTSLTPDKKEAERFLNILEPNGTFTFQTFDDNDDKKRSSLVRVFHGTLEQHFDKLRDLNARGAGVFVVINKTDLKGRKKENVTSVRAGFVDLDGVSLDPVLRHELEPTIIVESSRRRWHAYYRCENLPLEDFEHLQLGLIAAFDGDPVIKDLPRVMRLPGFVHQKVKKGVRSEPFRTRIENAYEDGHSYSGDELLEIFCPAVNAHNAANEIQQPSFKKTDFGDLEAALAFIDPEERSIWVKVGHALKSENPDLLSLFLPWSRGDFQGSQPTTYVSDADVISAWNSFQPERIGIGAVYALAKERGYRARTTASKLRLGTQIEVARLIKSAVEKEDGNNLIHAEGKFWRYKSTHWIEEKEEDLRVKIHDLDGAPIGKKGPLKLSKAFIDGVLCELGAMTNCPNFFDERPTGVNLCNGFVRLDHDGKVNLEPHSSEHRQRFTLDHAYHGNLVEIPDGLFRTLLCGSLGDTNTDIHRLVLEIIGSAITGVNTQLQSPKGFIFYGASAGNGKSAVQALIRKLFPSSAIASVPPADLGEPQFLATLAGCQVNLSDEISSAKAIASDRLKAAITGDPVSAKVVYQKPFTFIPRALHIFAANQLPSFSGGVDNGVERRLVVVPFERTIPECERIPELGQKIAAEEGDVVVSLAIDAAAKLLKRGRYSIPAKCEIATAQWFKDADPVLEWLEDGGLERHVTTAGMLLNNIYAKFRDDARELGISFVPSKRRFTQRLRDFIEADGSWKIVKRANGNMVFPNDLLVGVTEVTQFRENFRN